MKWTNVLELNAERTITGGAPSRLHHTIGAGADLRIYTAFPHNEHLEPGSDNPEIVDEVSEFRTTYLIDDRWVAGIMTTRMPIDPPLGFGPRPSMSYFLYNEDGRQAIARPFLDEGLEDGEPAECPVQEHPEMPKYQEESRWDDATKSPAHNFYYPFDKFRFFTNESWRETYVHEADGRPRRGSLSALTDAFKQGAEMKVGLEGLCADLGGEGLPHVVFVPCGPGYHHTESKVFSVGTHPTVRVAPSIPMKYESRNWDFGSLFVRTDGFVQYWRRDPYTMEFSKRDMQLALRWFVR
jgi:hypothetical protein